MAFCHSFTNQCNMKDEVVISGISGRFPECDNLEEFWEGLVNGIDLVSENDRRWPVGIHGLPKRKGTLKADLEKFDARFFNVTHKQAEKLDPQISQLLEVTYEAVLDAGVNPTTLKGSNIGVYVGCSSHDMMECLRSTADSTSPYDVLGGSACMLANRISFSLDLRGPSFTLDTYCSSSMVALHNAATAMRNGECEGAIVCGVNLLLNPLVSKQINMLGVLSADGKCKSFDASGNGYVRSEAVVSVFLQKKNVARRNYGTIVNSRASADGFKQIGISHPSRTAQEQLMFETYKEAGLDPNKVVYVEAHGTGTAAGDPEELNAIASIFAQNRTIESHLRVGSTKSNMGHSEGASSLCALSKMVLSLQKGFLPPNLHFSQPNPDVPSLLNGTLKVVTECTLIDGSLFSLNASGIGGSNAHVILRSDPDSNHDSSPLSLYLPIIVPFSGRTKDGVDVGLERIMASKDIGTAGLLQKIHETSIPGFDFRGLTIFDDVKQMILEAQYVESTPRPLWFTFAGMGAQHIGMARHMMVFPGFKKSITVSAEILKEFGLNLFDILIDKSEDLMNKHIGISYISMGMGLIDLLSSIGLTPDGLIGHSAGELLCAYADGSLTQRQALLTMMYKDESVKICPSGAMAAVGLTWEQAQIECPSGIYPACHNGSANVTVSGSPGKIQAFVEQLQTKGIFAKMVNSNGVAYHSPYIESAVPCFGAKLREILRNPRERSKKWISTSLPESRWNESIHGTMSPKYVINNFISPVYYYEALKHIPENAVVVEVSPHALFQSILKKDLPRTCTIIGLMKANTSDNPQRFISGLGTLFQCGFNPQFSQLYPDISFPVKKGTAMIAPLIRWNHAETFTLPDFNKKDSGNSSQIVTISLSDTELLFLEGHTIDDRILFPASGYLVLAWKALSKLKGEDFRTMPVRFENVKFLRATILPNPEAKVQLTVSVLEITGQFEISEGVSIVASGSVFKTEGITTEKTSQYELALQNSKLSSELVQQDIYKWFRLRGYQYDGLFRGIVSADEDGQICKIMWLNNWISFLDTIIQTTLFTTVNFRSLYLPTGLNHLTIDPNAFNNFIQNNTGSAVPVVTLATQKVISGPGIEFQGLKLTESNRREKIQASPIQEVYTFVPYIDAEEVVWDLPIALKICLDIILENTSSKALAVCEFVESGKEDSIAHQLEMLNTQPGRKVDVTLSEASSMTAASMTSGDTSNKVGEKLSDLLIIRENPENVTKYEGLIKPQGFALFITANAGPVKLIHEVKDSSWNPTPVALKKTDAYDLYVLKKKKPHSTQEVNVEVDLGYNWLDTVKTLLTNAGKVSPSILLRSDSRNCGIIGLVNCLRAEPRGGNIRCILTPHDCVYPKLPENDLTFNVVNDNGEVGSYRHLPTQELGRSSVECENFCLKQITRGNLSSLRWIENPIMKRHDNVYQVYYASLNFRDIMIASGQLSPEALPGLCREDNVLGTEFSGIDSHGARVMGVIPCKGFATQVCTEAGLFWQIPKYWTMEEAATIPVAYSTAYYALVVRGQIIPGECILIHSGAGAVGQAAISVALSKKCKVYITVGSDKKKAFLMEKFSELTERNFASSRTTDFKGHILKETNGRGVDVILNSLAEDKLQASLDLLACDGRFLEIGKLDLFKNSHLGMSIFLKNITFHGILLENAAFSEKTNNVILRLVQEGIDTCVVQPIKRTVFSHDQAEAAFRYMASGKHIGKIVLKIRDEHDDSRVPIPTASVIPFTRFNPQKIYIVVGGLGGVGLEMADWFVSRGAKHLAFVSRSGITNGFQKLKTDRWRKDGVRVMIFQHDTTALNGAQELFQECLQIGPIGGIFNLAMVLRDGIFTNQTIDSFETVLKPKLNITNNLDIVSRELGEDLEYFVVFSSVSCGRGNAGQSNYGMANSSMEGICENRRKHGFPALAIQWGAIAEAGVVHENMKGKDALRSVGGTVQQSLSSCFAVLDNFLHFQHNIPSPIVSSIVLPERALEENKSQQLTICSSVAQILGLKDTTKIHKLTTLGDLGVDSLISLEVQTMLEKHSNVNYSTTEVRLLTWEKLQAIDQANQ